MSVTINAKGTSVPSFTVGKRGLELSQEGTITPPEGNDLVVDLAEDKSLVVGTGGTGTALITATDNQDLTIDPTIGGGQNLFIGSFKWPREDGTNGQVLGTDGNGTLVFVEPGSIAKPLDEVLFGTGPSVDTSSALKFNPDSEVLSVGSSQDGFILSENDLTLSSGGTGIIALATNSINRLRISSVGEFEVSGDIGLAGQVLSSSGPGSPPVWADPQAETGTVSSVSVFTANGISGTVENPTTTPIITLTLGAITPSNITASGNVTGANLSGTNTGDQTITLTGDVTGTGTGSFTATIPNDTITNAKMANMPASSMKGSVAGGDPADLTSTQVTSLLDVFTGTLKGLTPASGGGTTTFLRADGAWIEPPTTSSQLISFNFANNNTPPPSSGQIRYNNTTDQQLSTKIYLSVDSSNPTTDITNYLRTLKPNTFFWVQQKTDSLNYHKWLISNITEFPTYFEFDVTLLDSNPTYQIGGGQDVVTAFVYAGSTADGTVKSVGVSSTNLALSVSGSPITTSGVITLTSNVFTSIAPGHVPASGGGATNYLNADGGWTNLNNTYVLKTGDTITGNLGVGIAPATRLDVLGTTYIRGASGSAGFLEIVNSTNVPGTTSLSLGQDTNGIGFIHNRANSSLYLATNNVSRMFITADGNIGIGLDNPASKLHVTSPVGTKTISWTDSVNCTGHLRISSQLASVGSDLNLVFSTGEQAAGGLNERMRIDSAGNVGVGVIPSAWGSGQRALQLQGGSLHCFNNGNLALVSNTYSDGTNDRYITSTLGAARYHQNSGSHYWATAPVGTAGNVATFTQKMVLDTTGNIGIGTASPSRLGGNVPNYTPILQVAGSLTLPYAATGAEPFRMGNFEVTNFEQGTNSVGQAVGLTFSNWNAIGSGGTTVIQAGVDVGLGGLHIQARRSNSGIVNRLVQMEMNDLYFFTSNVERAHIDSSGNLLVGISSSTRHVLRKVVTEGTDILTVDAGLGSTNLSVGAVSLGGNSGAPSALYLGRNSTNNRSINAGGTVNQSGADYAEYEHNNGLVIAKGDIVGFKIDGTLTLTFDEAIRFGIKSTNPGIVGGDTWGSEESLGMKKPELPEDTEADDYEKLLEQYGKDLAKFEDLLEAARSQVDRIAYAGKVPVNVMGAKSGDYIIPISSRNGSIIGESVSNPSFEQYCTAVGRVNRILEDGRAEVVVIVH